MIVNIILPVYNTRPHWIQESIDSIKLQTFNDYKVIIVNDASTCSKTNSYLNNIDDPFIEVKHNKKNIGEMQSRISGLEKIDSDCRYVAFMDADDIMLPLRIQRQVNYLDNNPEIDVVGILMQSFYDCSYENERHHILPSQSIIFHPFNVNDFIFSKHWCINNPSTLMKRKTIEAFDYHTIGFYQNKFSLDKNRFGDYIFYATLIKNGFQIRNIQEVLQMYRYSDSQLTSISYKNEKTQGVDTSYIHKLLRKEILIS